MSQTTELLLRIRQIGGEQLQQLGRSLNKLGQEATNANQDFKALASQLTEIQRTSANSINNLRGYANSWRLIANSVEIGTAEFKQATAEAAKLEAQLAKTQGRRMGGGRLAGIAQTVGTIAGAGVFGGPEGAIGAALGSVGGVSGAITGGAIGAQVGQLRQALGSTADYVAEIRKLQIALQGVAGSQDEYNKALRIADQATRQLNVPQEVAIQGMTKLTAAVKGAGGQVSDAGIVFTNITKAIKGTGGSAEDVQGAITAMVQVFSKGKVSAEELSGQLGERLPGAVTLFAKANKMTLPELQKGLKEGQIGLNELMRFIQLLGTEYGMTALKIAASSEDAGARLRVSFNDMRLAVGASLQPIGAELQATFADFIKNITPAVVASAKAIAAGIKFILDNASNIGAIIKFTATLLAANAALSAGLVVIRAFGGIQSLITGVFIAMQGGATAATTRIVALTGVIKTLIGVLSKQIVLTVLIVGAQVVINWLNKIKDAQDRIKNANSALRGESWVQSIGGKAVDFQKLKQQTQAAGDAYVYYADKIKEAEKELETQRLKPRREFLEKQIAADKASLAIAASRYKAGITALGLRKEQPLATTDFAAPEKDGEKEKKTRRIIDLTDEQLQQGLDSLTLQREGLDLQAEYSKFLERELDLQERLKRGQIGVNQAILQGAQSQLQLENAVESAFKGFGTDIIKAMEQGEKMAKNVNRTIQDIQIASGEFTQDQIDKIKIDRIVEDFRAQFEKLPNVDFYANKLKAALEQAAIDAKDKGKLFAKNFADGIKSMGDLAGNLGKSFANVFTGLTDLVTEFVTTGKASFQDFANSALRELSSIFIRYAAIKALGAFFPGLNLGIGATGGATGPQSAAPLKMFANGGMMIGNNVVPMRRYAAGGIARSPEMAIYGERGPEAYVPLPDGRTIPVKISGAMDRYRPMGGGSTSIGAADIASSVGSGDATGSIVDVRYTVERINSVDYVTADQFQRGMAQAASQGASQGEQRALKALQNNRSTRSRLGLR